MSDESSGPRPLQARLSSGLGQRTRFGGLAFLMVIAATIGVALLAFNPEVAPDPTLDEDLCPAPEEISASASFLVDLRKPLDPSRRVLPSELLRDWSLALAAGTELRVFAVTARGDSPREQLGRVCKPYANADLAVGQAKDQQSGVRDCDDVPAQASPSVRAAADRFCAVRDAIAKRVDALAGASTDTVGNVHLVEALEATVLEFEERPAPHLLRVFSDMLQHATWYSHFDLGWQWWRFEDFATLREQRRGAFGPRPLVPDIQVSLLHFARLGLTDQPLPKRALKRFWRDYFDPVEPAFVEQPTMAGYAVEPLMGLQTETDQALFALAQETTRLEAERQRQAGEARRLADLEAQLLHWEQRLQAQEAALADAQP